MHAFRESMREVTFCWQPLLLWLLSWVRLVWPLTSAACMLLKARLKHTLMRLPCEQPWSLMAQLTAFSVPWILVEASSNLWNFGNNSFSGTQVEFSQNETGPWEASPSFGNRLSVCEGCWGSGCSHDVHENTWFWRNKAG